MTPKLLDQKLARIHADPQRAKDFILADAKDADMALAIGAPGRSPEAHSGELRYRSGATWSRLVISWGFAEVLPERVIVLAERGVLPSEIDRSAALPECGMFAAG